MLFSIIQHAGYVRPQHVPILLAGAHSSGSMC